MVCFLLELLCFMIDEVVKVVLMEDWGWVGDIII